MTATPLLPERLESGGLSFAVCRRPGRSTLEITVERDASLSVKAPDGVNVEQIEAFVAAKRDWVFRKLAEKDALFHPPVVKQLIDGEGFAYLGRNHRLLIVNDMDVPVKLERGRLQVRRTDVEHAGAAVIRRWYQVTGTAWLTRRMRPWRARLGVDGATVEVAGLGYRWGSASRGERVNVHWATLQLPPSLIDYVLVHELAHFAEANHTARFWQLVARALPDYETRKDRLACLGGDLWLGDVSSR